jgi:hypothetical protein
MERNEMIDILNGMCERCLIKGIITTLYESKELCEVFDRFSNNFYTDDEQYSGDILYLYNLATKLHQSGNTSLEESYSIYNAILSADRVDFVEIKEPIENVTIVDPVVLSNEVEEKKKKKNTKKSKNEVIDISDIVVP